MKHLYKLRNLNKLIQSNKALIAKGRKMYVDIARTARNAGNNWTPEEHHQIQVQLRHALSQTKNLQKKVNDLEKNRRKAAATTLQSAWKGYRTRTNYNRRLSRSSKPQSPPKA